MNSVEQESWGRTLKAKHEVIRLGRRVASLAGMPRNRKWLAFGNGRSYGDSCLNDGGIVFQTRGLDRFMSFDASSGHLTCESGVLLADILAVAVPRGWFLPVTPGTQFVTLGGAIANDVHGKNHHVAGSFGNHLVRFELLRSDGDRLICSASENSGLFRATIGGLGLTGLVQWAEIQLRPIPSPALEVETIKFSSLDEFLSLSTESDQKFEYTVAWLDCLSGSRGASRGHFVRASHAAGAALRSPRRRTYSVPFAPRWSIVNRLSLKPFNALYYHRQGKRRRRVEHYAAFFYPLDKVHHWNRLYGSKGFFQFQCVVPEDRAKAALTDMFRSIAASGEGSFLSVLKRFGSVTPAGLLSFARPGVTLAMDFPNAGPPTLGLLDRLEHAALEAGGSLYPAKDGHMSPSAFRRSFPRLEEFARSIDPQFSSSFWRRVNA